jgi:hypothetical protein
MDLFKSKSNLGKKRNGSPGKGEKKKTKYVWLASNKAIFIIRGEVKESKYGYGLPIVPLYGDYKADGKTYTAKELSKYYVILNLPKDANVDEIKGKRVVVIGYDEDALYIDANKDEDEKDEKSEDEENDESDKSDEEESDEKNDEESDKTKDKIRDIFDKYANDIIDTILSNEQLSINLLIKLLDILNVNDIVDIILSNERISRALFTKAFKMLKESENADDEEEGE